MLVNLKSTRELKPKNLIKDNLQIHNSKIGNHNSRNKIPLKIQSSNKQIIKANSKEKDKKVLKQKIITNQILLKLKKKMISNLKKYNVNVDIYNKKIINDIIYDENKHIVSEFKNYLLWDENSDFLKRFYYFHESINRLPKINYYYETYTLFPPVYFCLDDLVKIMIKNVKRKKKYLEMIEEMEDNNNSFKKEEKKEFKQIINPKDISNTITFDPSSLNNIETNSFLNQNENCGNNYNLKEFDQIVNFILNDNENESIIDNKKNKKNNSQENKNSFINNNDDSLFNLNLDLENKKNKEEDIRGNITKKIEHSQKTIIPKKGKILEVKKLNFQNLNKEINKEINHPTSNKKKENKPNLIKNYSNNKSCKINYSDRHKKTIENLKSENKNIKTIIKKSPVKKILINKKLNEQIPISERISSSKKEFKNNEKDKINKSIEKMMKMIQYSQTSSRSVTNNSKIKSKTQNKTKNLKIETNSKKKFKKIISNKTISKIEKNGNIKSNTSNKKILVNKLLITSPNFIQTETIPNSFITNNNITSSIYNINLNLNLGHTSTSYNNNYNNNLISNKTVLTKRNSNYTIVNPLLYKGNSVLNSENKKIIKRKQYNIRNVIHNNDNSIPITNPLSKYSTLFKSNHLKTERIMNNKNSQKDKISYDLNGNNVHISIQKQSIYNTIANDNENYSNSSVNININCNNNIDNNNNEKINSRNEVNGYLLNNLKNSYSNNIKKKLVFPINEIKYSKSLKRLSTQKYKNNEFKAINNDWKYNKLEKIKKKNKDKKYPLTSRNEKKIHDDLISIMLKNTNK